MYPVVSNTDNKEFTMLSDLQNSSTLEVLNESSSMINTNPAVLCTLYGKVLDYSRPTRNNRLYTELVCDAIANSSRVNELESTCNFLGEGDHPMDYQKRADIHYPLVTHGVRNLTKVPEESCYKACIDILDTPNGRVIKTLIDYGTTIGVSSRGFGRAGKANSDGVIEVLPDNYVFITFDLVPYPGNISARLYSAESAVSMTESVEYSSDDINKLINENFTELTKSYLESDDLESLKTIKPVLTYLNESGDYQSLLQQVDDKLGKSISTSNDKLAERLLMAYASISEKESSLESKELIINQLSDEISELQSTSSGLSDRLVTLTNQLSDKEDEIKGLNSRIALLQSKLASSRDEVSKLNESYNLLGKELADSRKELASEVSDKDEQINELKSYTTELEESLNEFSCLIARYQSDQEDSSNRYSSLMESYLGTRCSTLGIKPEEVLTFMNESVDDLSSLDQVKLDNAISLVNKSKSRKRRKQIAVPINEAFNVDRISLSEDNMSTNKMHRINESSDLALDSLRETLALSRDMVISNNNNNGHT